MDNESRNAPKNNSTTNCLAISPAIRVATTTTTIQFTNRTGCTFNKLICAPAWTIKTELASARSSPTNPRHRLKIIRTLSLLELCNFSCLPLTLGTHAHELIGECFAEAAHSLFTNTECSVVRAIEQEQSFGDEYLMAILDDHHTGDCTPIKDRSVTLPN